MARTIRYAKTRAAAAAGAGIMSAGEKPEEPDGYLERLAKYVPAEVLTFFTAAVALTVGRETSTMLWIVAIAATLLTPFYLWFTAIKLPADKKPRAYLYLFAMAAFVVWAMNTSPALRELIGIDETWAALSLLLAVLVIPALDEGIDYLLAPKS